MSYRSLTSGLALYRSGTLTLEGAAEHSGVQPAKMVSALRSRGIPIRESDLEVLDGRRIT